MSDRTSELRKELYEIKQKINEINSDKTLSAMQCASLVSAYITKMFTIEEEIYRLEITEIREQEKERKQQEKLEKKKAEDAEKEEA